MSSGSQLLEISKLIVFIICVDEFTNSLSCIPTEIGEIYCIRIKKLYGVG